MIKANAIMVDKKEYEELIRLKELNREMVEALRDIQTFVVALKAYVPIGINNLSSYEAVMKHTQALLTKAEEEVEE